MYRTSIRCLEFHRPCIFFVNLLFFCLEMSSICLLFRLLVRFLLLRRHHRRARDKQRYRNNNDTRNDHPAAERRGQQSWMAMRYHYVYFSRSFALIMVLVYLPNASALSLLTLAAHRVQWFHILIHDQNCLTYLWYWDFALQRKKMRLHNRLARQLTRCAWHLQISAADLANLETVQTTTVTTEKSKSPMPRSEEVGS